MVAGPGSKLPKNGRKSSTWRYGGLARAPIACGRETQATREGANALFNNNVPARFQTELNSTYAVDEKSVTRHKPADPSRETTRQEKNIYYLLKSGDGTEMLNYLNKGWRHQSVKNMSGGSFKLESNGMISTNSRFHVGHKIMKML